MACVYLALDVILVTGDVLDQGWVFAMASSISAGTMEKHSTSKY